MVHGLLMMKIDSRAGNGFRQEVIELQDMRNNLDKEISTKLGMIKNVAAEKKEDVDDKMKQKDKKSK